MNKEAIPCKECISMCMCINKYKDFESAYIYNFLRIEYEMIRKCKILSNWVDKVDKVYRSKKGELICIYCGTSASAFHTFFSPSFRAIS